MCAAILTLAAAAFVFVACDQKDGTEALPLLSADGEDIVNSAGETVALRGTNFGGWLVQESWMCPTEQTDTLETNMTLYSRFGEERAEELIAAYEDSWITEEDFANVKALGLNVVRIPFTYMNLYRYLSAEDNGDGTYDVELLHPDDFTLREDAFGRLDWALEMCEKYGLYAILDLHGAVGSQNGNDHSGDTQLTDLYEDSALGEAYRAKTAELWGLVAEHFAGNTNVAGYDLLNEPGGASGSTQWDYYDVLYDAVRAADPDHMIFIEAVWEGYDLPSPSQYDWTNVVYEYHHYNWEGNNQSNKSFTGSNGFSAHRRECPRSWASSTSGGTTAGRRVIPRRRTTKRMRGCWNSTTAKAGIGRRGRIRLRGTEGRRDGGFTTPSKTP